MDNETSGRKSFELGAGICSVSSVRQPAQKQKQKTFEKQGKKHLNQWGDLMTDLAKLTWTPL